MIRFSKSMLLTLIVAIVALCSSYNLFSQSGKLARHDAKTFSFGLKAGLNMASMTNNESISSAIGIVGGAFGTIKLGTNIGVSTELLLGQFK